MAIKLIKACKELNIGIATLKEWCDRNGFHIELDPNESISDDLYSRLVNAFRPYLSFRFSDPNLRGSVPVVLGKIDLSSVETRSSRLHSNKHGLSTKKQELSTEKQEKKLNKFLLKHI